MIIRLAGLALLVLAAPAALAETNAVASVAAETNVVASAVGPAEASSDLAVLEGLLKAKDLKYSVCDDGEVKLEFGLSDNRTQLVFITPQPYVVSDVKVVHVYAPAYKGRLTKAMAMELLCDERKIGHWVVKGAADGSSDRVYFVAHVPSDVMPDDLYAVVSQVAQVADDRESAWTDADAF